MNEQKAKFKRQTMLGFILLLCLTVLAACGGQTLTEDFDEAALKSSVEEIIQIIADKDSDALRDLCNVTMKEALTDDVLSQIYEAIDEGGAFEEITDISFAGTEDSATEEEFALVVANAQYENRKFTYTMTFTKQMKLAGLFFK